MCLEFYWYQEFKVHKFKGINPVAACDKLSVTIIHSQGHGHISLSRNDVIEIAKMININAYDLDCSEYKALRDDFSLAEDEWFNESAELRAKIALLEQQTINRTMN